MAEAQKLVGVGGQDRLLQTITPLIEFFPEIRNKLKVNRFVDNYADMLGVDPEAIRDDDEADALTAQQNQQAAAAAQAENATKIAAAAKNAAAAPLDGNTALTSIIGNVTGAGAGGAAVGGGG
jgi:hypothetical protein